MGVHQFRSQIIQDYSSRLYMERFLSAVSAWKVLWIFGAGPGGKKVFEWLRANGISDRVAGFIDNSSYKQSLKLFELPVISPESFAGRFNPNELVIISSGAADEMTEQLTGLHIPNENIEIIDLTFAGGNNEEHEFIYGSLGQLEQVWSILADQKSKDVFSGLLNYKLTRDYQYLQDISDPLSWQYVDPDLIKRQSGVIADVGAYTGDSIPRLIEMCRGEYERILAFEADRTNYDTLCRNVTENKWGKVQCFNMGLWSEKKCLSFKAEGCASGNISPDGDIQIECDTLDHIIDGAPVNYMKMDIEGSELPALTGAEKTIRSYSPVLAISVYHRNDDFVTIPNYVLSCNPNYRLYFRHYRRYTSFETICYAIP